MKRSKHNLSYTKLLSMNMGELVPIGLLEVLPGDSIQASTAALVRVTPLNAPVMHPVHVRIHHWFVPHRLVWNQWEDFITGGPDGLSLPPFPTRTYGPSGAAVGQLGDYLGVPPGVPDLEVSALPIRGYNLIWNEWYRDQDLQTEIAIDKGGGVDATPTNILRCDWEKDYFTTSRPWEQKGPSVTIPLVGDAPVTGIGITTGTATVPGPTNFRSTTSSSEAFLDYYPPAGGSIAFKSSAGGGQLEINADLSATAGVTVNQLRESLALQRFEEARARYGSRYSEYLRALGVRSSDARLQRPEYLGGGHQTIQFSEVLQTATYGEEPLGQLYGHGISAMRSNRFRCFFEEHGYVFTVMSIRPKTIYANGLFRTWNKRTKYDFWQKELQHIGQQQVLNKEVYAAHTTPNGVFGYQDRYDEYRRSESSVAGEFRTSVLDFWHMGRVFATSPSLNSAFVSCVPTDRVFAIMPSVQDSIYVHARHSIGARRLVSASGNSFTF